MFWLVSNGIYEDQLLKWNADDFVNTSQLIMWIICAYNALAAPVRTLYWSVWRQTAVSVEKPFISRSKIFMGTARNNYIMESAIKTQIQQFKQKWPPVKWFRYPCYDLGCRPCVGQLTVTGKSMCTWYWSNATEVLSLPRNSMSRLTDKAGHMSRLTDKAGHNNFDNRILSADFY